VGLSHSPKIVTDSLVTFLDAANTKSYAGTGSTWFDLTTNGRNATKGGSQSPTYPAHNSAGYFAFTGGINGDNYSRFDVSIPTLSAITVLAFHYSTLAGGHILRMAGEAFQIGPDGYAAGTSYNNINCARTDTLNAWICDALTFSGTDLIGYRNGNAVSSATRTSTTLSSGTLKIGTRSDNFTAHYIGNIAMVQIYSRVLTAAEIKQNFNALRGRYNI
jgi:hypothetical protein